MSLIPFENPEDLSLFASHLSWGKQLCTTTSLPRCSALQKGWSDGSSDHGWEDSETTKMEGKENSELCVELEARCILKSVCIWEYGNELTVKAAKHADFQSLEMC
jgi:hypothetical protein